MRTLARVARASCGFVIFAALARALPGQAADSSVLRRSPVSMFGLPGFIQVPVAAAMPSGTVDLTFDRAPTPSVMPDLLHQSNAFMVFGFLPFLTVGARGTSAPFATGSGTRRDLSANAQFLLFKERRATPAVALGVQDIGQGATPYFSSRYLVASKTMFGSSTVSVGYGTGTRFLAGVFGGVGVRLGSWVTAVGEYDGRGVSGGVRVFPFPSFADRIGVQPRIDAVRGHESGAVVGIGLRARLGGRRAAPALTPRAPTWRQNTTHPLQASVPAPGDAGVRRAAYVIALAQRLVAEGFENVRVTVTGGQTDSTLNVAYENRRYNRDELDALGVVMGVVAIHAPPAIRRMRVTILRVALPVLTVESDVEAFVAFVNDPRTTSSFTTQLTFVDAPTARAMAPVEAPLLNPSRNRVDVFLRPRVETQVLTDYGVVEARVTAFADAYVQLGRGLVLNARRGVWERHSPRYWEGIEDPNGDRLLLHQALPLPLPARWARANALTQFTVGRFEHEAVGVANETDMTFADGLVSVGSMIAVFGRSFGGLDHTEALGTLRLRHPGLALTGTLSAGRFRHGDSGAAAELARRFGATELAFFLRATEFAKVAGVKLALPLTPSRELAPRRLRPRAPELYTQTLQSQVFSPIPYLRREVGRVIDMEHELERVYRSRDRLRPVTVVAHAAIMREAARRWLGAALVAP